MKLKYKQRAHELNKQIQQCYDEDPKSSNTQLAKKVIEKFNLSVDSNYLRQVIGTWKALFVDGIQEESEITNQPKEKKGFEMRQDGNIIINWDNRQIITDLGEYGNYIASFDRHSLIQRKYVYSHGNETASIVAMEFDFPHTKAVYIYARLHGFSKASPGQTDLEFELGLDTDKAVEENIQTMKRRVYKKTQKREWEETVKAAGKWWNFENTVLEAIQAVTSASNPSYETIKSIIPETDEKFASLIGISDVHYLKLCYDHTGRPTYNREIALERMKSHTESLARETARYGRPEKFIVVVGSDGMHVDGTAHTTTKGTPQHEATDGLWRLEFKNYVQMQIDQINYYKQISPVTVIPIKGNHDLQTSVALQAFMEIYFENDPMVEVVPSHDTRTYIRYGNICLVFTHGDDMGSIANLENQAHKLIMGEAKLHGINLQEVNRFIIVHGHEHIGSMKDLNGNVQRIGLSSMSDIDDFWHKSKGYVGRQVESLTVIVDPNTGRRALCYVQ